MSFISGQLPPYQSLHPTHSRRAESPSLGTRMFAVASAFLLSTGGASGALPLHPGRLQGGLQIAIPSIESMATPVYPQYGPFLSPQLSCHLAQALKSAFEESVCPGTFSTASLESYAQEVDKEISKQMKPYVNAVKGMSPVRTRNIGKFPENLGAFMHNEIGLVDNGNAGCILKTGLDEYVSCKRKIDFMTQELSSQDSESLVYTDSAYRGRGYMVGYQGVKKIHSMSLGMNPQLHTNSKNALDFITERVLKDDCFFRKEPKEILQLIQELHVLLMKDLPVSDEKLEGKFIPGKLRTSDMAVFKDEKLEKDLESVQEYLKTKFKATKRDMQNFMTAVHKMSGKTDYVGELTPAERTVWEKLVYFPPSHRDVEKRMQDYASDLKRYAMQDIHPIALAAWALAELGRIHPFMDGNGRLGRILMNALLVRGGYEPVVIPNDEDYTQALNDDFKKPGTFARYLAGLVTAQSDGIQVLLHVED